MKYLLVIKDEAHNDVAQAYEYYENIQTGLGERFLNALIEKYNDMAVHPHHYSFIEEDNKQILRDVRLKAFPFLIVFEISTNEVIVYAVHHAHRHPSKKLRRK